MKTILLITTLLLTVGCKQEIDSKISNDHLSKLKVKLEAHRKKVDSLERIRVSKWTYDTITGKFIKPGDK